LAANDLIIFPEKLRILRCFSGNIIILSSGKEVFGVKVLISCFLLLLVIQSFAAEENELTSSLQFNLMGSYIFGHQGGYEIDGWFAPVSYEVMDDLAHTANDPGREIGTTWGGAEAKAVISYMMKMPFLVGEGPLFSDNNVSLKCSGELSPVSVSIVTEFSFTPAAIFTFTFGTSIGTGWTLGFNGLGRNLPGGEYTAPQEEPFSGVVYALWLSGTFQFDLGAVIPGDWTHIVMQVNPRIMYMAFTGAQDDEAWIWEADSGENFNGFRYIGTYFIGYLLPLTIDTVGFLVETEQYIDAHNVERSQSAPADWNSAFVRTRFGPLFNIAITDTMNLALLPQFRTARKYTDATIGNRYFEYREYERTYVYFERFAFMFVVDIQ
jgi:hypothetical protein